MSLLNAACLATAIGSETRWELSGRMGYGVALTTGVDAQGAGAGLSLAYRLPSRLRLDVGALWSQGHEARAANAAITYHAEYSSIRFTTGVGYEFSAGPIRLRPSARVGAIAIAGFTRVGGAVARDDTLFAIVGPGLEIGVRVGRYEFGLDAEAYFVPRWVASPLGGIYGSVGVVF